MNIQWVPIIGKFDIQENDLIFTPEITEPLGPGLIPFGVVKCNQYFENGTISFDAQIGEETCCAQVVLNHQTAEQIFVGLNVMKTPYGIASLASGKWRAINLAGFGTVLRKDDWIPVTIKVTGAAVKLSIHGVVISQAELNIVDSQIGLFAQGKSYVHFRNVKMDKTSQTAFVIMQFSPEFDDLYREVIKPTCEAFGYTVKRADDMYTSNLIIQDITRSISEASLVIADVTPNNPNVYYEIGYSHAIRKKTVMLCDKKRESLPFDIAANRTIFYDNSIGGKTRVEEKLRKHLDNLRGEQ
ncbi:MAG: hypothetical protein V2A65_07920 [Candidatus Omnitrophota bacterium]